MSRFDSYATKYSCIHMRRENGILEMRFHTDNGPLRWGLVPHGELPDAFADVGRDRDNRVVILTGTGDEFSGIRASTGTRSLSQGITANAFDRVHWEGRALLMNLLNIEVPVISAINGPAWRHCEIPLLSDIVLASDTAAFQDSAHFMSGMLPGDGMHILMPMLLGMNRGRYFLLTGQTRWIWWMWMKRAGFVHLSSNRLALPCDMHGFLLSGLLHLLNISMSS